MSRLIDQLRASNFPDKSASDLALHVGRWVEANKRDDIFAANPDFAQEYHTLKDEIDRLNRPGYGAEFAGAFGSAVDDLQASFAAVGALAADGARRIGIPGAEPIRNKLLGLMKEQQDEASEFRPSVGSYDEISGEHVVEDTSRYVTNALGTVAPSMLQAAATSLAGAGIGAMAGSGVAPGPGTAIGAVGGALLGLAEKRLAQKAVSQLLKEGIKTVTIQQAAKAIPREMIEAEAKRLAIQYGGQAALAASSIGSEVGSIYAENPDAPAEALGYGVAAGLLDVLPAAYVASKFLGAGKRVAEAEVEKSVSYFRRFATEAAKVVPMEGTTEAAQTLLEIAAAKSGRGESPTSFTDDDYRQMVNAGIVGSIGGFAMSPVAAAGGRRQASRADPTNRLGETVVNRLPLDPIVDSNGPLEFGGDIPESDLISRESLPRGARDEIAAEERVGFEGFNPVDSAPYEASAAQPSVKLPSSIEKAVANAEEAAQAWEVANASTEPFPGETALPPAGPLDFGTGPTTLDAAETNQLSIEQQSAARQADIESAFYGDDADRRSSISAAGLRDRLAFEQENTAGPSLPSKVPVMGNVQAPAEAPTPVVAKTATPAPVIARAVATPAPQSPPLPVIKPTGVVTKPTVAQVIKASGNGVEPMPVDSAPNLKRVQIFTQPKPAPAVEGEENEPASIRPVEAQALGPNPMVELYKRVKKMTMEQSNVAVIIVDNVTGQAYQRLAFRGPNTVHIDKASRTKGVATGQGMDVSYEADFVNGNKGRAVDGHRGIFKELIPATGMPRYSIYGIGELTKPGKQANWNLGQADTISAHPGIIEAAKRGWTEKADVINTAQEKMPAVPKFSKASEQAGSAIAQFQDDMAGWLVHNDTAKGRAAAATRIDEYAEALAAAFDDKKNGKVFADAMKAALREKTKVAIAQTTRISDDYTVHTASVRDLFQSTLRALTESRGVDVAAFEPALFAAAERASQTTGVVITEANRRPILAFAMGAIRGPIDPTSVISLLHETGHIVTDGLAEPLRVAFHTAIDRMSWRSSPDGMGRWLMNPRSLDVRLLANADPAMLSLEQRAAMERLTAEEIAAARRIDPAALVEEQMAEHLAQLGWDKSEAKSYVQRFVRFIKELWFNLAMAVQQTFKGAGNISPNLARAYVENRYLQFIHRDSALTRDRINDLMTWLGVPATEGQKIPYYPAGADWDQRMQYVDVATGEAIPVNTGSHTPDSQARRIKLALDRAAMWVEANPESTPDTAELRFTKRGFFAAPLSSTPSITLNTIFAEINLEHETYRMVAAAPAIGPILPQRNGAPISAEEFATVWLKMPPEQTTEARKRNALESAKKPDPLTGAPVAHRADTTITELPSVEQKIVDREGRPKVQKITEAQDNALKQTILSLRETWRRVSQQAARDNERFEELTAEKERAARTNSEFASYKQYDLSRLGEEVLTRQKIALALHTEINRLLEKFSPADIVMIYPGAELLSVPDSNASEEKIRGGKKYRVPLDMTFATSDAKSDIGAEISRHEAWLQNPDNRHQGQIYGIISEQARKLRQIPFNQQRSAVSVFMRKIIGGFIDELNATGLPSLRLLGKRFAQSTAFVDQYRNDATTLGRKWETAFGQFAEAMGRPNDQAFVAEVWDPLSRAWNFVDSSERAKLGTPDEANVFEVVERALRGNSGLEIKGDKQRAALRALTMASIDRERLFGKILEQHPELKVLDKELGTYRRLLTHGMVTGSRGLSREMQALGLRMNPAWSDTESIGPKDVRTFWEAAGELYSSDRAAFDAKVAKLFDGYVKEDFFAPLANNNTPTFDVAGSDGIARQASILNVRQAYHEAEGDVAKFAEILHKLEDGDPAMQGLTVGFVMGNLRSRFAQLKSMMDKQAAAANAGVETLNRQMLDGREANDLPAQWVSYATMDSLSNLTLLHQLAMQSGFGPNALAPARASLLGGNQSSDGADLIAAGGEVAETVFAAKRELIEIRDQFNRHVRDGLTQKEVEAKMGSDDYHIALHANKSTDNLDRIEATFRQLHSNSGHLNTDIKAANDVVGLMATGMLQNPRSAIQQFADILGMMVDLKLSTQTFRGLRKATKTLAAELGNSVLEAFGQQAKFSLDSARLRKRIGAGDSETRLTWKEKSYGMGPRNSLARPVGHEGFGAKAARTVSRVARRGREILPNIGSPSAKANEDNLGPKLTAGLFHTITKAAMNASIDAGYELFADIGSRGVDFLQQIPAADRAQFVRELELGVRDLGADELGYQAGFILNDKAAFLHLKNALETQMAGERSVGGFVAKAYRRMEAAQREAESGHGDGAWDVISDSQFVDIVNYTNSQWTLQPNFATLPAFMQGRLKPLFIFLTWPYLAMRRAARGFTDDQQRMTWVGANSSVADGLKAFFLLAAPATIAGSFAVDWYDKYLLGKKQNLREAPLSTAIPVLGAILHPAAYVERWARYGTAGFPSEILNMAVNYDSQKQLSLDSRVVAFNAIESLFNSLIKTPISQEGNLTYASFGRPILQSIGGGGVLQYLQISQNLLGLNNQDAAINARINTSNYLRSAGRELDLPVRILSGASMVPTPITPYLQQMELGALVNNQELFRDAYRSAVKAAREDHPENPEKYVADNFAERHPLKKLFKGAVSESDYRKMLLEMGEHGAGQVRAAINSYNRYLTGFFNKKSYYGKIDKAGDTVEELIRKATQINSGF